MKKLTLLSAGILLLFGLFFGVTVMADDDEQEDYENGRYEKEGGEYESKDKLEKNYEEHGEDNDEENVEDDEYEYRENNQITEYNEYRQTEQTGYWNIWTREVINNSTTVLPIETPSNITLTINNKQMEIYAVPREGQLLISAEKLAEKLDAEVKVYNTSKIVKVTKNGEELIIKAGSNAAYENSVKTPMPVEAVYYEKSVYIPICVLANALGYRIDWAETERKINLVSI